MPRGRPRLPPGDRTTPIRLPIDIADPICRIATSCHISNGAALKLQIRLERELQRCETEWATQRYCFEPIYPPVLVPNQGERIAAALSRRRVIDADGNTLQMVFLPCWVG